MLLPCRKTDTTLKPGIDTACRTTTTVLHGGEKKMRKTPILTGMTTAAGLVAALGVVVAPAAGAQARGPHHSSGFKVIASHLNNPRGLAWAPAARSSSRRPGAAARPA